MLALTCLVPWSLTLRNMNREAEDTQSVAKCNLSLDCNETYGKINCLLYHRLCLVREIWETTLMVLTAFPYLSDLIQCLAYS